jgi:hypothetical protein
VPTYSTVSAYRCVSAVVPRLVEPVERVDEHGVSVDIGVPQRLAWLASGANKMVPATRPLAVFYPM